MKDKKTIKRGEIEKIEYFTREQISGPHRFACSLKFYRITNKDGSSFGIQQSSSGMSYLKLNFFDDDKGDENFSPIVYKKDLTFDEFVLINRMGNIYNPYLTIDE